VANGILKKALVLKLANNSSGHRMENHIIGQISNSDMTSLIPDFPAKCPAFRD
jgi:hypothetical protein